MGLCYLYLRNVKGFVWNLKRVYRIYRELELNLKIKPKRRIRRDKPETLSAPVAINQVWSMDLMSDSRLDLSLPSVRVTQWSAAWRKSLSDAGSQMPFGWIMGQNTLPSHWLIGRMIDKSHCYIFNLASQPKILISNDLTARQVMSCWI